MNLDMRHLVVGILGSLVSFSAVAAVREGEMVSTVQNLVVSLPLDSVLESAKTLFWSLATMSLVWTLGAHVLRQDIGEALMELLRFLVVTGFFFWLLVRASGEEGGSGFIRDIVDSFFGLDPRYDEARFRNTADAFVARGLDTYFTTLNATSGGSEADQLLAGGIAILVLVLLTIVGAQFLLALVMAWLLGYAGIFLLGFGGARWTSAVAVSYYKHALATGVTVFVLGLVGAGGLQLLDDLSSAGTRLAGTQYDVLGKMIAVSLLILVMAIRIPQLFYTMVTGSTMGAFAGTAGMIGSAIATGGGAAIASATGRGAARPSGGQPEGGRAGSVMDAVHRSSVAGGGDAFHASVGADPFGMPRAADRLRRGGSVFGDVDEPVATVTVPVADRTRTDAATPGDKS